MEILSASICWNGYYYERHKCSRNALFSNQPPFSTTRQVRSPCQTPRFYQSCHPSTRSPPYLSGVTILANEFPHLQTVHVFHRIISQNTLDNIPIELKRIIFKNLVITNFLLLTKDFKTLLLIRHKSKLCCYYNLPALFR